MTWSKPDLLLLICNPTTTCPGIQSLEQEVAQEEGASQALKEEAQRRETALQQLRTAVKEVSSSIWASWYCLHKPDFSVYLPHPYSHKSPHV